MPADPTPSRAPASDAAREKAERTLRSIYECPDCGGPRYEDRDCLKALRYRHATDCPSAPGRIFREAFGNIPKQEFPR